MARVLVVGFSVVPGPDRHGVQLLHAVRALASRFAVDVLTLRVGELAYVERYQKTRMLRVPVSDGPMAARVDAFRRAVRRQLEGAEYDVVHFRDAWAGVPVLERRAALGYRTVFDVARSVHGDAVPEDAGLAAELGRDEALCWEQADLVLTGSESGRRFIAQGLPPQRAERVLIVPPGVDIDRFDTEPAEAAGPPVVLYTGTVAGGHGVRVLLRAFRDVLDRVPAKLVLAGPLQRDFVEPLGTAIDQLGLAPHVELAGPIDNEDMARVISRAAVCVAPTAIDLAERPLAGFPTKLLEYMACRRPVIAPRRSSVRELLQDGVEGVLFEPHSPRDLADKLLRLLTDEPLRARLAEAGQRRVRLRFPASALRRHLLEAYAALLPPATWNPVGAAASRLYLAQAGAEPTAAGAPGAAWLDEARLFADTSPALRDVDDDGDSNATLITSLPHEDTTPGLLVPAAASVAGTAAAGEPWLVIAGDGSIRRTALFGAQPESASPSGGRFLAGELDVPDSATLPSAPAAPFVAAGELLGQKARAPGPAAAEPEAPRLRAESES